MTTPTATIAQLQKLDPCKELWGPAQAKLRAYRNGGDIAYTVADARAAGVPLLDTLWAIDRINDGDLDRKIRLFLCDCAAHVLHLFEDRLPKDDRPRKCIEFCRANPEAAEAARAAWAAGAAEAAEAAWAAWAAWATEATEAAEASRAAEAAEREWQYERLELWFSDNEPEPWPLPEKKA